MVLVYLTSGESLIVSGATNIDVRPDSFRCIDGSGAEIVRFKRADVQAYTFNPSPNYVKNWKAVTKRALKTM